MTPNSGARVPPKRTRPSKSHAAQQGARGPTRRTRTGEVHAERQSARGPAHRKWKDAAHADWRGARRQKQLTLTVRRARSDTALVGRKGARGKK